MVRLEMRKIFMGLVVFGLLCGLFSLSYADYVIYGDSWTVYPSEFWAGGITIDDSCPNTPALGDKCIKIIYDKDIGPWGTGVRCLASYQADPPDHSMCLDLTGFTKLSFKAKAAENNTKITFWMGSKDKTEPIHDTCGENKVSSAPSELSTTWKEFTIDLAEKDMSDINTVFGFIIGEGDNGGDGEPNPVIFYIDDIRYHGLTITDLTVRTGFHKREIDLTWTAPTAEGEVDEYIVKYSPQPITNDNFEAATTYEQVPKWEPNLPGIAEKHILTDLTPGTFYYVAIKAKDIAGNPGNLYYTKQEQSANKYRGAIARAQTIGACIEGSYDFGGIDAGDKLVSNECFVIKHIGDAVQTYSLNLIDPPGWKAIQSEPTDHNTYILNAMFNSEPPSPGDFNENQHALSTEPVECGSSVGGKFAGDDEDGVEVPIGDEGERHLWVQFKAPQTSSIGAQQKISICVTVQSP